MSTQPISHYVAHLKVEEVKIDGNVPIDRRRQVSEVTQITIKDDDLNALLARMARHINIIEEDS